MATNAKTYLITGATDGIGLETAIAVAHTGAAVIIHGRNAAKGEQAVERVKTETGNQQVSFVQADFASLSQVRAMAEALNQRLDSLDVLVNNAGTASTATYELSEDGYELTFAINHLAPFLLTQLLLPKLKKASNARIVNVSSVAHKFKPLFDINDLMSKQVKPINAYSRSKFANILFNNALVSRLEGTAITANVLHPGTIKSNFGKEATLTRVFYKLAGPLLKTPLQGAQTSIHLALSPEVEGKTGGYYVDSKLARPHPATEDAELAEQLWEQSEQLVSAR